MLALAASSVLAHFRVQIYETFWKLIPFPLEKLTNRHEKGAVAISRASYISATHRRENHANHGVGSPDYIQESDIFMLYYLSHSHFV